MKRSRSLIQLIDYFKYDRCINNISDNQFRDILQNKLLAKYLKSKVFKRKKFTQNQFIEQLLNY